MKIKYLLLLLIILSSCKDDISNGKFRNENYVFYQENGKAGEWLKINPDLEIKLPKSYSSYFFPNGNRYAELEVIDSFPNRKIKYYDKVNDNLTRTSTYKSDSLISEIFENGYYRQYYSSLGFLQSEGQVKNRMSQGKWKFYRENGETIKQTIEYVNDTLQGIREDYWENGKLKSTSTNINGRQNGKTIHYHENGEIEEVDFLKNGEIHGISTRYYANGKLESKCDYWNGLRRGTCKFYYKNGNLKKLEKILLDTISSKSSGTIYRYYESGEIEKILDAVDNQVNGKAKIYYKNGNLAQEFDVTNNIKNGVAKVYYETGELKYAGFARNNALDGEIKYYDKKGNLTKTVIGENGIAIDSTMH